MYIYFPIPYPGGYPGVPRFLVVAVFKSRSSTYLQYNQAAETVRDKDQRPKETFLIRSATIIHTYACRYSVSDQTFLFRLKASNSRWATDDTFWRIALSPNHCDWYPYRMMRALGATAGSISSASSQLTHCGLVAVPTFALQPSSGCAPIPWIATMLACFSMGSCSWLRYRHTQPPGLCLLVLRAAPSGQYHHQLPAEPAVRSV